MVQFDDLLKSALMLNDEIKDGNLEPARTQLASEIGRLNQEFDLDALLPGGGGELGMAAKRRDVSKFYDLFIERVRANLCAKNGEFTKLIRQGIQSSVGATLTALVLALHLPGAVLTLLVPMAVLICHSGLEAFCALPTAKM
ncbi:hypothetical protein QD460_06685 [Rhizobium jaguaris]|uniref:Uncharacterized protein n=2 Tax=Rhizobium jaguaris TaxID=1312183 RepID=A0A387FNZ8_9HYPH|nr:hypothetical protein CCGE525_03270 [Rhizobium jaguaris]